MDTPPTGRNGYVRPFNPQPVKAILAELGVSQRELSRRYDFPVENLTKVVNGRVPCSEQYAEALMEVTGLPIGVLFEPDLYVRTHWYRRQIRAEQEAVKAAGGEVDE